MYVTTLRANSDAVMSSDCNDQFREIVSANSSRWCHTSGSDHGAKIDRSVVPKPEQAGLVG
jgi:hypothetical protein